MSMYIVYRYMSVYIHAEARVPEDGKHAIWNRHHTPSHTLYEQCRTWLTCFWPEMARSRVLSCNDF